ncbi:hypothetical protein BpHYR1_032836 [Brachionus plicatilis]|uniref:Uncharacterized protein n=1 Tax=Brachionus plicatilis TaxID=10195 RepID=A0A3M7QN63_BRAPC|nr:hypothetical protein BpHYR1_032836 [Brachionus plicatilis]
MTDFRSRSSFKEKDIQKILLKVNFSFLFTSKIYKNLIPLGFHIISYSEIFPLPPIPVSLDSEIKNTILVKFGFVPSSISTDRPTRPALPVRPDLYCFKINYHYDVKIISRFLCDKSECKSLVLNPFRARKKFKRIASPEKKYDASF